MGFTCTSPAGSNISISNNNCIRLSGGNWVGGGFTGGTGGDGTGTACSPTPATTTLFRTTSVGASWTATTEGAAGPPISSGCGATLEATATPSRTISVMGRVMDSIRATYGIWLRNIMDSNITGNDIRGLASYSVYLNGSVGNLIYGNTFTGNNGAASAYSPGHSQA